MTTAWRGFVEQDRVGRYLMQQPHCIAVHLDQQTGLTLSWLPEINSEGLQGA